MTVSILPPTPSYIPNFPIEALFSDKQVLEWFNEIKLALYYTSNPYVTNLEAHTNWTAMINRLSLLRKRAVELRRDAQRPKVIKTDIDAIDLMNRISQLSNSEGSTIDTS